MLRNISNLGYPYNGSESSDFLFSLNGLSSFLPGGDES